MLAWLLGVVPPDGESGASLATVVLLILGGSAGTTALSFWRQHKQGSNERDTLIANATSVAVAAAKTMLEEYRIELGEAKAAILELRQQLAEAGTRIAKLEQDLLTANGDRERLKQALDSALERRARMTTEIATLYRRVADLENLVQD